uniref:Uncharacterized protein n=1 Tax=Rhodosorus marinus TaxID=101924 RepID=A0A7S2ZYT9_9RHOD|mmetsp:Transcript_38021/g.151050  ORF Transcript_38021/g.151050 Transcript_38021/m.151050 type:complete len:165 (+) Transcript_38021:605-1099(+)|eukprot:CAMPEP_0113963220 /NCGR_PEP_ID=MMETSP0011_2-20120614/6382_1 /TAXON_ID=101924 /ORGANISM="Rhodosorus marinus" /LENGTH=164 /DNA_ID=CAMNT_0000975225 /DNA_START=466 /DNA_END=960 /DNA_ORIENTATION=- /assembly_acc=CAM_ASM_000156
MKPKGGTRSGGSVLDAVRRAASKDNSRVRTQGGDIRGGGGGGDGGLSARFAALSEKAGGRVTKESTPRVRKIITRDEIKKRDGKKGGKLSSKKKKGPPKGKGRTEKQKKSTEEMDMDLDSYMSRKEPGKESGGTGSAKPKRNGKESKSLGDLDADMDSYWSSKT